MLEYQFHPDLWCFFWSPSNNSCHFKLPFLSWSHQFRQPCEFPAKACWFHWRHRPLWLSILQYLYCWGGMEKLDDSGHKFHHDKGIPHENQGIPHENARKPRSLDTLHAPCHRHWDMWERASMFPNPIFFWLPKVWEVYVGFVCWVMFCAFYGKSTWNHRFEGMLFLFYIVLPKHHWCKSKI